MPVSPISRYRNLNSVEVFHATRGPTRSLPIRRFPIVSSIGGSRPHRFLGHEGADLLALKYLSREELYWHLLDANGGKLPDELQPGEMLQIPPLGPATQIDRNRR